MIKKSSTRLTSPSEKVKQPRQDARYKENLFLSPWEENKENIGEGLEQESPTMGDAIKIQ